MKSLNPFQNGSTKDKKEFNGDLLQYGKRESKHIYIFAEENE